MKKKMVFFPPLETLRWSPVEAAAEGRLTLVNATDEATAKAEIGDAHAFYGKITPELLGAAKQLEWIQAPTASLEHYVFPELVAHSCVLTNMRGLFFDVIADHVMGYLLCFARHFPQYLRQQMRGEWSPVGGDQSDDPFVTGPGVESPSDRAHEQLSDATLGIIGLGSIGREIARRALAFSMTVQAVDPVVDPGERVSGVTLWGLDRLDELLATSDYVVIAAPHTPDTEGMIDRPQLQRMKRSARLINIGRGAIVRLDALVAALNAGEIAGAALDVFEIEPLPPDHPLWRMENVLITPHVAARSVHVPRRHLALLVDNVRRFSAGQPLRNVVTKSQWF